MENQDNSALNLIDLQQRINQPKLGRRNNQLAETNLIAV
ncbi:cysteine hydrolase, partial [Pseudomonas syringae pv. tagetis]